MQLESMFLIPDRVYALAARVLFMIVCGILVGGGMSGLMFHGQVMAQTSIYERLANQEQQLGAQGAEITVGKAEQAVLEREISEIKARELLKDAQISELQKEIASQHGMGLAAGAILGALMFFNTFFKRRADNSQQQKP